MFQRFTLYVLIEIDYYVTLFPQLGVIKHLQYNTQ